MKDESFQKSFAILVEGLKVERILGGKRFENYKAVIVYPMLILYRLCFSMIPAAFYNKPGVQIVFIIILTLGYLMILASLKIYNNKIEYYVEIISECIFLTM